MQRRRAREAGDERVFDAEPAEETAERIAALELIFAHVLQWRGEFARVKRKWLYTQRRFRRRSGVACRRDGGKRRHGAERGDQTDREVALEGAGQRHQSARILCYSEACEV